MFYVLNQEPCMLMVFINSCGKQWRLGFVDVTYIFVNFVKIQPNNALLTLYKTQLTWKNNRIHTCEPIIGKPKEMKLNMFLLLFSGHSGVGWSDRSIAVVGWKVTVPRHGQSGDTRLVLRRLHQSRRSGHQTSHIQGTYHRTDLFDYWNLSFYWFLVHL